MSTEVQVRTPQGTVARQPANLSLMPDSQTSTSPHPLTQTTKPHKSWSCHLISLSTLSEKTPQNPASRESTIRCLRQVSPIQQHARESRPGMPKTRTRTKQRKKLQWEPCRLWLACQNTWWLKGISLTVGKLHSLPSLDEKMITRSTFGPFSLECVWGGGVNSVQNNLHHRRTLVDINRCENSGREMKLVLTFELAGVFFGFFVFFCFF